MPSMSLSRLSGPTLIGSLIIHHSCSRLRQKFIWLLTQSQLIWVRTIIDLALLSSFNDVSLSLESSSFVLSVTDNNRSASCRVCHACTVVVKCLTLLGRAPQDAIAELKALANIILSSIEQIEQVTTANSFTFPSPDSTFCPESEAPRMHPAIQSAGSLIASAAAQLITLVRPAPLTLLDISTQVSLEVSRRYRSLLLTARD